MPVPLVVGGAIGIYNLVRSLAVLIGAFELGVAFEKHGWRAFLIPLYKWVASEALGRAGLELDETDPFSDASMAAAISKKVGFTIRSVLDRDVIEEDLLTEASRRIEEKTGVRFSNLRDREQVIRDALDFGVSKLGSNVGLVLTDPLNPEALKADVIAWGKEKIIQEIGEDIVTAVSAEWSNGVSLLQMVRESTGRNITARELMSGLNAVVVKHYSEKLDRFNVATKADKRRLQNRESQRRFRDKHKKGSATYDRSGRPVYIPVGWDYRAAKRE